MPDRQIRFCTTPDGVRVAYVVLGQGPPIVFPPRFTATWRCCWTIR
jgi:hypothetical protein